jgi:two-component system LytT family response regulator
MIVDDEPLARERVLRLLARDPDFVMIGECASVAQALNMDLAAGPDLVFLDVRMPARDGFELLQAWSERGIEPFVIFVTAFSDFAIQAFEVEAVDYLLKPFDDERFFKAAARAKAALETGRANTDLAPDDANAPGGTIVPRSSPYPKRLLIAEESRVTFLPTQDVEFVQSAGKVVKVFAQGRCLLLRQPMQELEARLDPNQFVRIHRSSIVNVDQIVEMHPLFHGDYEIVLKRGTRLPMSRRFRNRFDRFLVDR